MGHPDLPQQVRYSYSYPQGSLSDQKVPSILLRPQDHRGAGSRAGREPDRQDPRAGDGLFRKPSRRVGPWDWTRWLFFLNTSILHSESFDLLLFRGVERAMERPLSPGVLPGEAVEREENAAIVGGATVENIWLSRRARRPCGESVRVCAPAVGPWSRPDRKKWPQQKQGLTLI